MNQFCISMRPGTILMYKGRKWRVTANDTLNQVFTMETIDKKPALPHLKKRIQYHMGQEVQVRWKPHESGS